MSSIKDVIKTIGSSVAITATLAVAPPAIRAAAESAIAAAVEAEREQLEAEALGMTVQEMRLMKAAPAWLKVEVRSWQ